VKSIVEQTSYLSSWQSTGWKPALLLISLFIILPLSRSQETTQPPDGPILPESSIPEYEKDIDHAGYIRDWNKDSFKRGNAIYQKVCHSCHGDEALPGSLPNALRFAEGEFQHGNDPFTIYQTLTRGWRLMIPQTQLVPQEKYDVIHYILERYVKEHNPKEVFEISEKYLARLPQGSSRGPTPVKNEPWRKFDYGDFLINTYQLVGPDTLPDLKLTDQQKQDLRNGKPRADTLSPNANFAYKGIAVRLDSGAGGVAAGSTFTIFEHDTLRMTGAWIGRGFIDWNGIQFNQRHAIHPKTIGELQFELPDGPGWANPKTGSFKDPRIIGLDGRRYGPLPQDWGRYKGLYHHNKRVIVSYSVGDASILESHRLERMDTNPVFIRTLNIGRSSRDLLMRVAKSGTAVAISSPNAIRGEADGLITLKIPANDTPLNLELILAKPGTPDLTHLASAAMPENLEPLTRGGPTHWPEAIQSLIIKSDERFPFAYDRFTRPTQNPWKSQLRTTGLDFTPDGKTAFICCWDGEVWRVDGIDGDQTTATWRRIAAGLFQPLGLKVVDGQIYVTCRDQLVVLRDFNGDGETDFYECVNSDHQVTDHFHEFTMGLQVDEEKNFYYAKSARNNKAPIVPHHGTLIKISADGSRSEIIANGFRSPNGVCRNPDGTFIVTDQEGFWMPMNRINWVTPGGFYGNMWGYGAPDDSSDSAMVQPLAWVDKRFVRSPAELLWIDSEKWGALNGKLLLLSYGLGLMEIVLHERIDGQMQGGLIRLPLPELSTGIMRGRFHPNGHLYVCGMSAWATDKMDLQGGFYRIRATGNPAHLSTELKAHTQGIDITFSDPIDPTSARDLNRYAVRTWELKRTSSYGSKHYNEQFLEVRGTALSRDGKTLSLHLPDIKPVWQMEIQYKLTGANGEPVEGTLQNTIHKLGKRGRSEYSQ
jgi:hypothetical protein